MSGAEIAGFLARYRARRRDRAIRVHSVRAGSPPGPADRLYFVPPKAY